MVKRLYSAIILINSPIVVTTVLDVKSLMEVWRNRPATPATTKQSLLYDNKIISFKTGDPRDLTQLEN
jgi:hypothetical protein